MSWWDDQEELSEIDIIKKHISLMDIEMREHCNLGFDYSTEDDLLDAICEILILDTRLFKIEENNEST